MTFLIVNPDEFRIALSMLESILKAFNLQSSASDQSKVFEQSGAVSLLKETKKLLYRAQNDPKHFVLASIGVCC